MPRAWRQVTCAASFAALTVIAGPGAVRADVPQPSPSASAAQPSPSASAAAPSPPPARNDLDGACDPAALTWAKGASQRSGLPISPSSCPNGGVRLVVAGAGCDFEVRRDRGFQRTPDGAFAVSPIANLDWGTAPEPMKKALAAIVAALAQDPSLPMGTGALAAHPEPVAGRLGSERNRLGLVTGVTLLSIASLAFYLRWRRFRTRGIPPIKMPPGPPDA